MGNANSGRRPNLEQRRRVAALRAEGLTLAEIGRRLGMTRQLVHHYVHKSLPGSPPPTCGRCGSRVGPDTPGYRYTRPAVCPACVTADPAATFAERLESFRVAAGLTREELADRAGLCGAAVSGYERGLWRPRRGSLAALARVLGSALVGADG
jgi:transcriptional regulator with XRE-family HTH domain